MIDARAWLDDELHTLLRETYGFDLGRGGTDRALADHVDSQLARSESPRRELELLERVRADVEGERERLLHAVTVRHSWFFRDPEQLAELAEFLVDAARRVQRALEIWVAGCASGEEAWTIALIADRLAIPVKILATDVDPLAIADARAACYGEPRLRELPDALRRHFVALGPGRWRVDVAALGVPCPVEFAVHNLCDEPPDREFDVICCRNVLIYLVPERARAIVANLRAHLRPEGRLVLGGIDQLTDATSLRRAMPNSIHARPEPAQPASGAATRVPTSEAAAPERRPSDELFARASEAIASGRSDEALTELEPRVGEDPLNAELHFWIGLAHHHAERPELAIAALRRARCLAPELWPASLFAALAHERLAHEPAAQRCWTELARALSEPATPLSASAVLLDALPGWRGDARALARIRSSRTRASKSKS
ncbi:CheR family methyltransferase [Nannocystaceae bacterium ST9]